VKSDLICGQILSAVRAAADPERAVQEKRYLKSSMEFLGVSVPGIRASVKTVCRSNPALPREGVLAVVDSLWAMPFHECRMAAVELLHLRRGVLEIEDIGPVERLCREARTWALVDPLAEGIAGYLVERFPELNSTLDRWIADPDFWIRRASLLSLLPPLRRGDGDVERFFRYADTLLDEREFFIRKAIGWILREMSKKRPDLVASWLLPRAHHASGVTVREAVKYLSPEQKEAVLRTHRSQVSAER
jgi:3-methyladenine DNA glycosylase AlkD